MRSPFKFLISPINNEQYVNQIGNLIVNTSIEEAEDVQRIGIVQSLPFGYSGFIQKGDEIFHWKDEPKNNIVTPEYFLD